MGSGSGMGEVLTPGLRDSSRDLMGRQQERVGETRGRKKGESVCERGRALRNDDVHGPSD